MLRSFVCYGISNRNGVGYYMTVAGVVVVLRLRFVCMLYIGAASPTPELN